MPIIISPLVCIFCLHFVFHCQEKWYYYIHILYYTIHTFNRMDKYFDRLTDDLESYAHHAKRKTIEMEDAVLLLKRFVWRIANHLNVKWPSWCHVMRTYSIVPERQQFLIHNLNYCSCGSGRNFKVFDIVLNESINESVSFSIKYFKCNLHRFNSIYYSVCLCPPGKVMWMTRCRWRCWSKNTCAWSNARF